MVRSFVSLKSFWEFGTNRLVCQTSGLLVGIFRVSLKSDIFFSLEKWKNSFIIEKEQPLELISLHWWHEEGAQFANW